MILMHYTVFDVVNKESTQNKMCRVLKINSNINQRCAKLVR